MRTLVTGVLALSFAFSVGCGDEQTEFRQDLMYTAILTLDSDNAGMAAASDQTVLVSSGVDFFLSVESPDLVEYRDKSRFRELQIQKVEYSVQSNSINRDIAALEIAVGPVGVEDPSASDAVLIATTGPIEAGTEPEGDAEIHHSNAAAAAKHVFGLDFGVSQGAELQVSSGETVPGGSLKVDVVMTLVLIADKL
jgi:hypothetical protein